MAQINKPTDYFNTVLYTGTGSSNALTGVGFQPDWVWIKRRNGSAWHILTDAVRGVNSQLYSNDGSVEGTLTNYIQSFDSDGFTLGTNSDVNGSSDTYASWNWLGANTTASNTDGSITSTVSANTTSGFSIVSYTGNNTAGATVGHGLSQEPNVIIFKNRDDASTSWCVYHSAKGTSGTGRLNTTNAFSDTAFITTTPSSSVFTLTATAIVNASSNNIIAYCFAEKKGFSKFGSYTGNGSNFDNTFVYTGFRPALVIVKRTDTTGNWVLEDNKRIGYNQSNYHLYPNLSNAEGTNYYIDFLSNGFKIRDNPADIGASNGSYIYMAFAENPLVGTNNIPATAR